MIFRRKKTPLLKLPIKVDVSKLNSELERLKVYDEFSEFQPTISLVNRGLGMDEWQDGVTTKVLTDNEDFYFSEGDYTQINKPLHGSYFEECFSNIRDYVHNRTGRVRLFRRQPQTCSSLHRDLDVRLHLALRTSEDSFLVFPEYGVFRIPLDGHFYFVDTTIPHFAVNANRSKERVHLVVSTFCGFREQRGMEMEIIGAGHKLFEEVSNRSGVERC